MNLPFKMRTGTKMEQWRHDTFWEKEPECLEWIKSFSPHDVFFDVGANVGVYSLYASSLFYGMHIYAFEPMPLNYGALIGNRDMNGFMGMICLPFAVGSRDEWVSMDIPSEMAGATGTQIKKGPGTVCVTIDGYSRRIMPTHIKIDIDGQELQVVLGMRQTLPHIKSSLIEVSGKSKADIVGIMTAAGFSTDNRFNSFKPHSSDRRRAEGIDAENIVFTR